MRRESSVNGLLTLTCNRDRTIAVTHNNDQVLSATVPLLLSLYYLVCHLIPTDLSDSLLAPAQGLEERSVCVLVPALAGIRRSRL